MKLKPIKWDKSKYYYWPDIFARQTGTNGEITIITGGKGIGKTFGLRLQCTYDALRYGTPFVELCRTKVECKAVALGYFDKLQSSGYFAGIEFKTDSKAGYANFGDSDAPDWRLICYFVALSNFQQEKKRTFVKPRRFIFDEAIIDTKDRYHRYLPDEFLIFANLLDTISRQQPGDDYRYNVYIIGNAVDLNCPYLQHLGINSPPEYGFHWRNNKTVLYHHVPPLNADERKTNTLVGRLLAGDSEARVIFDNEFSDISAGEVASKTPNANYQYAIVYNGFTFALWVDWDTGLFYVNEQLPANAPNVYTITKADGTVDRRTLRKTDSLIKILNDAFYIGSLRYETPALRVAFHGVLSFLGVR